MKRLTFSVAGAALIILGTAAVPAHADCAADIKKVEVAMKDIPSNESTSQGLDKIKKILAKSKKLLTKKKNKKCNSKIAKAMKITEKLKNKSGQAARSKSDCAADIKKVEGLIKEIGVNKVSRINIFKIQDLVDQSKEHLSNKNKKECKKAMKKATKMATTMIDKNIN